MVSSIVREWEIEKGVDQECLVPVHDQAGVRPSPATVGLEPGVIAATEVEETVFERVRTEAHVEHRSLRTCRRFELLPS